MLKELGNEIIELFKEGEAKDTQISELQAELNVKINEIASKDSLLTEKENIISIKDNDIANLQSELKIKIKEVEDKDLLLAEQNKEVTRLQEQASLKLDEVKAIIEELKGLIVNA